MWPAGRIAVITAAACACATMTGACRDTSSRRKAAGGSSASDCIVKLILVDGTPVAQRPVRLSQAEMKAVVVKVLHQFGSFKLDLDRKKTCLGTYVCEVDLDLRGLVFEDRGRASILISIGVAPYPPREGASVSARRRDTFISRGDTSKVYTVSRTANLGRVYLDLLEQGVADVFRYIDVEHTLRNASVDLVALAIESGNPSINRLRMDTEGLQGTMASSIMAMLGLFGVGLSAAGLEAARQAPVPVNRSEEEMQEIAMKVAGARRLVSTIPQLLKVYSTGGNERLRELALTAMVRIGDRRVVPHLVRQASTADPSSLREIIEALAQLGGPKARAYLELTADGHADEEIRKMASSALKRLTD